MQPEVLLATIRNRAREPDAATVCRRLGVGARGKWRRNAKSVSLVTTGYYWLHRFGLTSFRRDQAERHPDIPARTPRGGFSAASIGVPRRCVSPVSSGRPSGAAHLELSRVRPDGTRACREVALTRRPHDGYVVPFDLTGFANEIASQKREPYSTLIAARDQLHLEAQLPRCPPERFWREAWPRKTTL